MCHITGLDPPFSSHYPVLFIPIHSSAQNLKCICIICLLELGIILIISASINFLKFTMYLHQRFLYDSTASLFIFVNFTHLATAQERLLVHPKMKLESWILLSKKLLVLQWFQEPTVRYVLLSNYHFFSDSFFLLVMKVLRWSFRGLKILLYIQPYMSGCYFQFYGFFFSFNFYMTKKVKLQLSPWNFACGVTWKRVSFPLFSSLFYVNEGKDCKRFGRTKIVYTHSQLTLDLKGIEMLL